MTVNERSFYVFRGRPDIRVVQPRPDEVGAGAGAEHDNEGLDARYDGSIDDSYEALLAYARDNAYEADQWIEWHAFDPANNRLIYVKENGVRALVYEGERIRDVYQDWYQNRVVV